MTAQRLPFPYRPEADIVAHRLQSLQHALDWAAAAQVAQPWVQAVRQHPPRFWAMESLLKEYPISSAEGLALMRLAEALLRVPDAETAIALTADQLGRAAFEGSADSALARLSHTAIAMAKKFLPDGRHESGLLGKLGAKTVVAATLRAVQLLGRQFVLGQDMGEALREADAARRDTRGLRYSYDMLGEGARTEADALQYLASYQDAIELDADLPFTRAGADRIFLEILTRDGFAPRWIYYAAVRIFGGGFRLFTRWKRSHRGRRVGLPLCVGAKG